MAFHMVALIRMPMVSPLLLPSKGSLENQYRRVKLDQSPGTSRRLSMAKETRGMMAKKATMMTRMIATAFRALPSLTRETWPDLPVTVVKLLRLPVNQLFSVRMPMENSISTMATT